MKKIFGFLFLFILVVFYFLRKDQTHQEKTDFQQQLSQAAKGLSKKIDLNLMKKYLEENQSIYDYWAVWIALPENSKERELVQKQAESKFARFYLILLESENFYKPKTKESLERWAKEDLKNPLPHFYLSLYFAHLKDMTQAERELKLAHSQEFINDDFLFYQSLMRLLTPKGSKESVHRLLFGWVSLQINRFSLRPLFTRFVFSEAKISPVKDHPDFLLSVASFLDKFPSALSKRLGTHLKLKVKQIEKKTLKSNEEEKMKKLDLEENLLKKKKSCLSKLGDIENFHIPKTIKTLEAKKAQEMIEFYLREGGYEFSRQVALKDESFEPRDCL